ncbi:MAG: YraN family protein [Candidatus Cloacimonetes bacterium]|nr:YraN family protein [Candidatus Cloacimonadota bacterium]
MSMETTSMRHKKRELGKNGEDYCVQQLEREGYEVLERNYRSRYGEIDIIARDGIFLVFIEVKTRTNDSVDKAKIDITYSKQKKITKTAMYFLVNYHNPEILEYRFDVMICIDSFPENNNYHLEINHFKNAFPPSEVGDFFA